MYCVDALHAQFQTQLGEYNKPVHLAQMILQHLA
jgi:hypothetical protein